MAVVKPLLIQCSASVNLYLEPGEASKGWFMKKTMQSKILVKCDHREAVKKQTNSGYNEFGTISL